MRQRNIGHKIRKGFQYKLFGSTGKKWPCWASNRQQWWKFYTPISSTDRNKGAGVRL